MKLTIMHEPIGQPRPRARVLPGPKPIATMYDDKKHQVTGFKQAIKDAALAAGVVCSERPISLIVWCFFPRPQSLIWKKKAMPRVTHAQKPDADNVAKAVLDALNGVAWKDDGQVWNLRVFKWVCDGIEPPHVDLEWYEDEPDGIPF